MSSFAKIFKSVSALMVFLCLLLLSNVFAQTAGLENVPESNAGAVSNSIAVASKRFDFDGDGRADQGIFRPSNGTWYLANSGNNGVSIFQFGLAGDVPVAADYDGDGKTDAAVYRNGAWYRLKSATGTFDAFTFGLATDLPVPADFDGDGKTDVAVFRPSNGTWHRLNSANNSYTAVQFGMNGDVPLPDDYDGDGKADVNVFRASNGTWYRLNSANGAFFAAQFGTAGDLPQSGDFDGDSKADLAIWRQSTGVWYVQRSGNNTYLITGFGLPSDEPVAADYDGDGKTDVAVFRPSDGVWYRLNSSTGVFVAFQFGLSSDRPVPGRNTNNNTRIVASVEMSPTTINLTVGGPGQRITAVARDASGAVVSNVSFSWQTRNAAVAVIDQTGLVTAVAAGTTTVIAVAPNGVHSPTTFNVTGAPTPTPTPTATPTPTPTATPTPTPTATPTPAPTATPTPAPTPTATPTPTPTATPTPTPTATPTPTPTPTPAPSPSPTPTMFTCDYYASPTGSPSGTGAIGSPWDLHTALTRTTLVTAGKTLCLRGGTYNSKYRSTLNGATVRSAPGEWAKIDGYRTTTLAENITSTQSVFSLTNGAGFGFNNIGAKEVVIGSEVLHLDNVSGNRVLESYRARSGSISSAQAYPAGTLVILAGTNLQVEGNGTIYRDFEITCSNPNRNAATMPELGLGNGIINVGNGNKFVNLIVHDTMNGVFTSNLSQNTEIYGVLSYNNGQFIGTEGKGHGLYLENSAGFSRVYETISLNNFNLGAQYFGVTASYVGGDTRGSVFANNGSPLGRYNAEQRNFNLLVGTDSQRIPTVSVQNNYFFHPYTSNGSNLAWGYGAGIADGTVANNYFVGGGGALIGVGNTTNSTINNNQFFSTRAGVYYAQIYPGSSYAWNNNTYHKAQGRNVYALSGVGVFGFSSWKTQTGFDLSSVETNANLPDTVVVRPNAYTPGRAHVIVYSPSRAASVSVNLSTAGLANGQSYTIRNAFNYGGEIVASGTYNASSPVINLPLSGNAALVAPPVGFGYTPPTTAPDFALFVVVP